MRNLGVELNTIDAAPVVLHRRNDIAGRCCFMKARRHLGDVVAVAHPGVELERQFVEEFCRAAEDFYFCMAVFAARGRFASAIQIDCDHLHSITDA